MSITIQFGQRSLEFSKKAKPDAVLAPALAFKPSKRRDRRCGT